MAEPKNDWRMQLVTHLAKEWTSPWTGKTAPVGSQVTQVSVIQLKKKKLLTIAVPSATALCLSSSRRAWLEARRIRTESRIDTSLKAQVSFESYGEAFDYIEGVMESAVMAFTAIEAFVNEVIPEDYKYHTHRRSDVILEVMDKAQIERWLSLDEKLSEVLPSILSIPSPKGKRSWNGFKKLKDIRDRIIHMKEADRRSSGPENPTLWHDLFKLEPPHMQAKEIIDYFATKMARAPRWHGEYPD